MGVLQRLKEELEIERERYSRTKWGKLFALLLYVGMFLTGPVLMEWFMETFDHPDGHITLLFIVLSNMVVLSGGFNLSVWALSKLKIPFFEQYRINPDKPWPWEETDPAKKEEINGIVRYNLLHGGFKYLIIVPALTFFVARSQKSLIVTDMSLTPSSWEMLPQMAIMFMVEDFLNYFIHWGFHHPLLYRFHKEHHQYKYSIPLTAWHFHYVEFVALQLFCAQMYLMAAHAYAPVHVSTLMVWYIFRFWNNNSTHCGYIFPWTPTSLIPFCLNDEFHDFHHTHNDGNYGLYLRIWDVFFGTTKAFRQFKARQALQKSKQPLQKAKQN